MKSQQSWIRRSQRVIRMVGELHRLGYQKLRVFPYEYPLAWRLHVGPKRAFSRHNGAFCPDADARTTYSSASENTYFGWRDVKSADARRLAECFVERFPDVAEAGRGRDWEYAGWLAELLGVLEQGDRLPFVTAEWFETKPYSLEHLPIRDYRVHEEVMPRFPLPPSGDLDDERNAYSGTYAPHGLAATLANALMPGYLGNPAVVRRLIEQFVLLALHMGDGKTEKKALFDYAERLGTIFAGQDPEYPPIGSWNGSDQLGVSIVKQFGRTPDELRQQPFPVFIMKSLASVSGAVRRFFTDETSRAVIIGYATAVFLGYPVDETLSEIVKNLGGEPTG